MKLFLILFGFYFYQGILQPTRYVCERIGVEYNNPDRIRFGVDSLGVYFYSRNYQIGWLK